MRRASLGAAVVASLASAAIAGGAPARRLTLAEAIDLALSGNPQLAIDADRVVAAEAQARADQALRGPLIAARASALVWNRAIVADLGELGPITIRDRVTGSLDLAVSQPVSGALVIGRLVERDRAVTEASRAQRAGHRIEIAYRAAETYLAALQASALAQVAAATEHQLDGDLQRARQLLAAGTLQRVDVLRLEVERARVEQQGLQAETAAASARGRLGLLLGLPDGTELALADVDTTPPELASTEAEAENDAVARARRDRAELHAAEATARAADAGVGLARSSYYPAIAVVAQYSRAIHAGLLSSPDAAFVGVTLDWTLWDWGRRAAEVEASQAADRQARRAQAALGDQIAADTRARWREARLARATLEVADRRLAAAAEARRIQAARFAQGAATTIEVLDAETALASAQAEAAIGRYQYLVAWMGLSREVGALPLRPEAR
ncbi:MAG TPA: TolC family protein [Kofleriaceae bacterium]|jgi:outer membrane protein TolC|nr:TolC family protein [Kofleriaceae bacterium]